MLDLNLADHFDPRGEVRAGGQTVQEAENEDRDDGTRDASDCQNEDSGPDADDQDHDRDDQAIDQETCQNTTHHGG